MKRIPCQRIDCCRSGIDDRAKDAEFFAVHRPGEILKHWATPLCQLHAEEFKCSKDYKIVAITEETYDKWENDKDLWTV